MSGCLKIVSRVEIRAGITPLEGTETEVVQQWVYPRLGDIWIGLKIERWIEQAVGFASFCCSMEQKMHCWRGGCPRKIWVAQHVKLRVE